MATTDTAKNMMVTTTAMHHRFKSDKRHMGEERTDYKTKRNKTNVSAASFFEFSRTDRHWRES